MEDSAQYGDLSEGRDKRGRFVPGNQEGKKRGENKVSQKTKESILNFLERNIDDIQHAYDSLKPADKLRFITDIIPFAVPKLSSVQSDVKVEGMIVTPPVKVFNQAPPMADSEDKIDV